MDDGSARGPPDQNNDVHEGQAVVNFANVNNAQEAAGHEFAVWDKNNDVDNQIHVAVGGEGACNGVGGRRGEHNVAQARTIPVISKKPFLVLKI